MSDLYIDEAASIPQETFNGIETVRKGEAQMVRKAALEALLKRGLNVPCAELRARRVSIHDPICTFARELPWWTWPVSLLHELHRALSHVYTTRKNGREMFLFWEEKWEEARQALAWWLWASLSEGREG